MSAKSCWEICPHLPFVPPLKLCLWLLLLLLLLLLYIFKGFRPCRRPRKRICKGSLAEVNVRKVPHVLWTMQLFGKVKQHLAKYTWCRWLIGLEQMPQCSNFIKGWWNRQEWRDSWHEACSEPNNTSMCIWAERPKTKLLKAIRTRKQSPKTRKHAHIIIRQIPWKCALLTWRRPASCRQAVGKKQPPRSTYTPVLSAKVL